MKTLATISKSVLFQNKKYSIETYLTANNKISLLVVKDEIFVDYPIKSDNGNIAYDFPEKFPKYIKDKIKKYYSQY